MKNLLLLTLTVLVGTACIGQKANAAPTFVGDFMVDGGMSYSNPAYPTDPFYWGNNPLCYTGQEAAALLFSGVTGDSNPNDYLLSIDPSVITLTNHTDSWGGGDTVFAEDHKVQTGTGYNDPYGGPATSAYVFDHTDDNKNYVWWNACDNGNMTLTPEPCTLALLGLGGIPLFIRRKRNLV